MHFKGRENIRTKKGTKVLLERESVCVCVCVGGFCKKIKTNNKFKGGMAFFHCLITGRGHLLGLTIPNL